MAQYDIYRHPNASAREQTPFLLDLQSNLLDQLITCVVAPLVREGAIDRVGRLHPTFIVDGVRVVMATDRLAAIQRRLLTNRVGSLAHHHYDIIAAIDILWAGV